MDEQNLQAVIRQIEPLDYDLCVLTGDYRQRTWGPVDAALAGMEKLREAIRGDTYAVLGNHDSVRMVPALEDMGYRLLMNEMVPLEREQDRKSTRLNSSHVRISYAVFCLKKKKN